MKEQAKTIIGDWVLIADTPQHAQASYNDLYQRISSGIADLNEALERADRLINWMSKYIGQMAPGDYGECYIDLNAHYLFMHQFYKMRSAGG